MVEGLSAHKHARHDPDAAMRHLLAFLVDLDAQLLGGAHDNGVNSVFSAHLVVHG